MSTIVHVILCKRMSAERHLGQFVNVNFFSALRWLLLTCALQSDDKKKVKAVPLQA